MTSLPVIAERLDEARQSLLELTTRSRLLHAPRKVDRSRTIEIDDELSDEIFKILVRSQKSMLFNPREGDNPTAESEDGEVWMTIADDERETGLAERYTDNVLQTPYGGEKLDKLLLQMYYDARAYEEEHGVGIMYLALGFLKWLDKGGKGTERRAPLILLPVQLERQSARKRFKLHYLGDDLSTNLSLQAKLLADFGLKLPEVPDIEELVPSEYCAVVAEAVSSLEGWGVLPDEMQIGFFSFTKFLMYRDLDPASWPENQPITGHTLVKGMLGEGFQGAPALVEGDERIDKVIDPGRMFHIVDADSSQALVVEEAARGRNLVVQGPPGTGKSQTIANLIATAVKDGKSVLFVAEKMAALNVVKKRLDNAQLGEMCLELHSHKAQKRAVLDELDKTMKIGRPATSDNGRAHGELQRVREQLNEHADRMHTPLDPCGITPFRVIGELVRLAQAGVSRASAELERPTEWPRDVFDRNRELTISLAKLISEIGTPAKNPWLGVGLPAVLPSDVVEFTANSGDLLGKLELLLTSSRALADSLKLAPPRTLSEIGKVAKLANLVSAAPALDRASFSSEVWTKRSSEVRALVDQGRALADAEVAIKDQVHDAAWHADLPAIRKPLAIHGRSWFRFLNASYRRANAEMRSLISGDMPKRVQDRIGLLDQIQSTKDLRAALAKMFDIGKEAFGHLFCGVESDWNQLAEIVAWSEEQAEGDFAKFFRHAVSATTDPVGLAKCSAQVTRELGDVWQDAQVLLKRLAVDLSVAFEVGDARKIELATLRERLVGWRDRGPQLQEWVGYQAKWTEGRRNGLGGLLDKLHTGTIDPGTALVQFEVAYFTEVMRQCMQMRPEIPQFRGTTHDEIIERFRRLDTERIGLARAEVALAHYEKIPRHSSDLGGVGVVRREIAKKRRLMPIRQLMKKAGHAVQAIKPVFMMSPLSVAQYLEPGSLEFDLLLIDEASQVRPVDALGAVARARQMVVVGDDRQLPPTSFFSKFGGDSEDSDTDDEFGASDVESILGLCCAQNVPNRMLRWHYRSRHHSLIAVSNREYYESGLYVIPSPTSDGGKLGLRFRHVEDGVFDRGGSATNRIEAEHVARAVMEHAREHPELSLGVGAFSVAQRDAILFEVERLRRETPEAEVFLSSNGEEPFFVKNLETIQGDERDVIMISVGYGPDKSGAFMMNFGPLGMDGGERRLNVLITRARCRCEVFASITDEQLDLNRARGLGPRGLKTFLRYARTGNIDIGVPTGRGFDSPFEEAVARRLAEHGYEYEPQVGVAGFFIDIGVKDPDLPGRFLLGVECDGASYHSARWARDRDRIRQTVLEDRGWVIHRIWSTDWFLDEEKELRRLLDALAVQRSTASQIPTPRPNKPEFKAPRVVREEAESAIAEGSVSALFAYQEADFPVQCSGEVHEMSLDSRIAAVVQIVKVEGLIHRDEIARRLTTLAGKKRTGKRISDAVEEALKHALVRRLVVCSGDFFRAVGAAPIQVRDRTSVTSATLRKPEYLPPEEIGVAIRESVEQHVGLDQNEVVVAVARALGFASTGAAVRQAIETVLHGLLRSGALADRQGRLFVERWPAASGDSAG